MTGKNCVTGLNVEFLCAKCAEEFGEEEEASADGLLWGAYPLHRDKVHMELKYWPISGYLSESVPTKNRKCSFPGGLNVSFQWVSSPDFKRVGISEGWEIYEGFEALSDLEALSDCGAGEMRLTAAKGDIIHRHIFRFRGEWTLHPAPPVGKLKYSLPSTSTSTK